MNQTYVDTVRLLLAVAPEVFASGHLGLKGGTALNLFVHDMPRLSVDIDVVFLDHALPRDEAIIAIGDELARIKARLESMKLQVAMPANQDGEELKLVVSDAGSQVKIEVNQVFRGTVLPIEQRELVATAQDLFTTSITLPVLAGPELYGSKLVAAFDRQHPRDWFDVWHLLQRNGLTLDIAACFVAYLAGHNRPVHEVLFPTIKPMQGIYNAEFIGMAREDIPLAELEKTRSDTLAALPKLLTSNQREFLLSLVRAEPRWELMSFKQLPDLPAVRWKLQNLEKLKTRNQRKFADQHEQLEAKLLAL
ncbi:MAG TPA: nucleotidyl transferase AbiEii/AbiGii toxin family protein [Hydrogenophaga sp.]|uniref:nucleotidyl transferase AbiEii/AbiGii toxin family protein n=1 Tax=Hydrogenophaga sp. TaxID=1904254 RepID=UPI002D004FD1|nr:nucleotidyl transferase AbiEii/AbiGii toxin family protein [Hydrogenophaga sp.]HSX92746.1 nucleotidyl transferase AbiEii/AbiGii toxin family protein [Hydrogenophaga sp.]